MANEGSESPHPVCTAISSSTELMVFVHHVVAR
jgi:hypothetical protein